MAHTPIPSFLLPQLLRFNPDLRDVGARRRDQEDIADPAYLADDCAADAQCEPYADVEETAPPHLFDNPEDDPTVLDVDYDQPLPDRTQYSGFNMSDTYEVRPSQFVTETVMVPDKTSPTGLSPFSFAQRRYLQSIYDSRMRQIILMAGRQVEKSFTLACLLLTHSALRPRFNSLYVTPSAMQTKEFSKMKLREIIASSPVLSSWFPPRMAGNTLEQQSVTNAWIKMRYAFLTADRCRGISTDFVLLDEFQHFLPDNVGVIEHAASHSAYKLKMYAGTPLSMDNPIEYWWSRHSTQCEWMVPCERHGTGPSSWYYQRLAEANIGDHGLICDRCGSPISAQHPHAQWVRQSENAEADFEGFRIPQIMVPWVEWSDILRQRDHSTSKAQFMNECLGLSYDSGARPISREQLIAACDSRYSLDNNFVDKLLVKLRETATNIYGGVDWGQEDGKSYTVLSLGAYIDGVFRIIAVMRFTGSDSRRDVQLGLITRIMNAYQIRRLGSDYGGAAESNPKLLSRFGSDRIHVYQYGNSTRYVQYDAKKRHHMVARTAVMSAVFLALKTGRLRLPKWAGCFDNPFGADILAIFSQYNEETRQTSYMKPQSATDDTFHSILYCFLASMQEYPRNDLFIPSAAIDRRLAEGRV